MIYTDSLTSYTADRHRIPKAAAALRGMYAGRKKSIPPQSYCGDSLLSQCMGSRTDAEKILFSASTCTVPL